MSNLFTDLTGKDRSRPPRVMVFDSGVGGFSVIREIKTLIPESSIIYVCDNAAFPYGLKSEPELLLRVEKVIEKVLFLHTVDIVVIACNTASTIILPNLRQHINQPVVGVVPAIKPAAAHSTTNVIGLLATPGTVSRDYTNQLSKEHASNCKIISIGSSELVEIAEKKLRGQSVDLEVVKQPLQKMFSDEYGGLIDTVVLACTHFPLIKEELIAAAPQKVTWIDSGEAIARRTRFLLEQQQLLTPVQSDSLKHKTIFTAHSKQLDSLIEVLSLQHESEIEVLNIE